MKNYIRQSQAIFIVNVMFSPATIEIIQRKQIQHIHIESEKENIILNYVRIHSQFLWVFFSRLFFCISAQHTHAHKKKCKTKFPPPMCIIWKKYYLCLVLFIESTSQPAMPFQFDSIPLKTKVIQCWKLRQVWYGMVCNVNKQNGISALLRFWQSLL